MQGRKLILNDGTEYDEGEAGASDGLLWCFLKNAAIPGVYADFSDPEKTRRIVFHYGEMQTAFEDYTELTCIRKDQYTGDIAVQLAKEVNPVATP